MRNQEKKGTKTEAGVVPALANFFSQCNHEALLEAPVIVQEMFNDLMDTPLGDDLAYRQRMLITLSVIQDFGETIKPFTQQQLKAIAVL